LAGEGAEEAPGGEPGVESHSSLQLPPLFSLLLSECDGEGGRVEGREEKIRRRVREREGEWVRKEAGGNRAEDEYPLRPDVAPEEEE
jgi:hypothetical protein